MAVPKDAAAPDLAVIDRAIERIEAGAGYLTCMALWGAAYESGKSLAHKDRLIAQYRRFCRRGSGTLPGWWNGLRTEVNKAARLKALRAFRRACINAAKRG